MAEISTPELLRKTLRLSIPTILENWLQSSLYLVDAIMVARLGETAIAASGLVGILMWRLRTTLSCSTVGAGAMVARRWGEGRFEEAGHVLSHALVVGIAIGAISLAACWPLSAWLLGLMRGSPDVLTAGVPYMQILLLALPIHLPFVAAMSCLRSAGDTRTPLLLTLGMNIANIFLNWVFIFGNLGFPALGLRGSALATSLSIAGAALVALGLLWRGIRPHSLHGGERGHLRTSTAAAKLHLPGVTGTLARVSIPSLWEEIATSVGFLVFGAMIAQLGTISLAAHTACARIESFSYLTGWGIAIATGTLVGQHLGAREVAVARRCFSLTLMLACTMMGAIALVFALLPDMFLGWFGLDGSVRDTARILMFILAIEQPLIGSTQVLGGGLRGAGDTVSPFVTQLIGTIGVRVGLGYHLAFTLGMGVAGIYWATVADWSLRTLVLGAFVLQGRWTRVKV